MKFDEYVLSKCKKAGKKLSVFIRVSELMTFAQRRNIMKAFIKTRFGYCPLVLMFCGIKNNACINYIHERALKAVYNDEISPFEQLLERDKSETMYIRNIKTLAVELFRIKNNLSNDVIAQLISKGNSAGYNLRSLIDCGIKALRYFGLKI